MPETKSWIENIPDLGTVPCKNLWEVMTDYLYEVPDIQKLALKGWTIQSICLDDFAITLKHKRDSKFKFIYPLYTEPISTSLHASLSVSCSREINEKNTTPFTYFNFQERWKHLIQIIDRKKYSIGDI